MASALVLMGRGVGHLKMVPHGGSFMAKAGETAVAVVADSLVGGAVSYGIGQCYHRYPDKWYGKHLPKVLAGLGKLGAVVLGGMGGGMAAGIANSVGQAGINAYMLEMGLKHARVKTGKKAVVMDKNAALPAGAQEVSIGAGTRSLSFDQIENFASMR